MSKLALECVRVPVFNRVVFKVKHQEPREVHFDASNGVRLRSADSIAVGVEGSVITVFLRGENTSRDTWAEVCGEKLFKKIAAAVNEYNGGTCAYAGLPDHTDVFTVGGDEDEGDEDEQ